MSRNLYNFYSADGTFYPSQKKNVTIENFTSGPQVIETFGGPPRYFKLKTGDKFLKIIEETVIVAGKKGDISKTNYNLIESDNESSIFTYDHKNNRILTADDSENKFPKSIRVTSIGSRLIIAGAGGNGLIITRGGGSEFTAEGFRPTTLKWKHKSVNLVLNLIDFTNETENLLNTVNTAQGAVETAQGAFDTAQGDLTAAQGDLTAAKAAFDTAEDDLTSAQTALENAQGTLNTAQDNFENAAGGRANAQAAFDTAQDAFETAQGNLTDAQNDLTDAQTAFENA